jgi:PleD family two-component response regulator
MLVSTAPIRNELRRILISGGHDVTLVESEDRLWSMLEPAMPELLVLELGRARAAERVSVHQLHERLGLRAPAILVIAESEQAPAAARCLEAGVEDCLIPPFLEPIVRARVAGCLARHRLRRTQAEA